MERRLLKNKEMIEDIVKKMNYLFILYLREFEGQEGGNVEPAINVLNEKSEEIQNKLHEKWKDYDEDEQEILNNYYGEKLKELLEYWFGDGGIAEQYEKLMKQKI